MRKIQTKNRIGLTTLPPDQARRASGDALQRGYETHSHWKTKPEGCKRNARGLQNERAQYESRSPIKRPGESDGRGGP